MTDHDSDARRAAMEHEADIHRARLITALSGLAQRGHQMLNVQVQTRRYAVPLLVAGGGVVLALTGRGLWSLAKARWRRKHPMVQRLLVLALWWRHPERLLQLRPQRSLPGAVLEKVAVSTLTFVATELAKKAIQQAEP